MFDPRAILATLQQHGVEYVIIGGIAVQAHGHARTTMDVDIAIGLDHANLERTAAALGELSAELQGVNADADIDVTDPQNLGMGATFSLATRAGDLDVFTGQIPGGSPFGELVSRSMVIEIGDMQVRIVGLDDLISMKRASGRPQDLEDISALTEPPAGDS